MLGKFTNKLEDVRGRLQDIQSEGAPSQRGRFLLSSACS